MIGTAEHLRTLQADADRHAAALADARRTLNAAGSAYDKRRRYAPAGVETRAAHTAWALALGDWARAVIAHAVAVDQLRSERRDVDHAAENAVLAPTRRTR